MSILNVESIGPPTQRNRVWRFLQALAHVVFGTWLRFRAIGLENIPQAGPGLIIANHVSFLDPLLVGLSLTRPVSFVARDSLFRLPVVGWILRNTYVMPINRESAGTAVIRQTIERLNAGFLCGIFPEGTRSRDGEVGKFKPGFIALIRRSSVPIYPAALAGTGRALGRGAWFLKPVPVRAAFGKPISVETIREFLDRDDEQGLIAHVRERVIATLAEAEACLKR
jgi:1-acyl-sn-glycerol-3-phosphate acyltransferase